MQSSPTPPAHSPDPSPIDHVFRWDLDKTYLSTQFDTVPDLIRTFLQTPQDKINVPGSSALLRELLREDLRARRKVTFISGSPRQMRKVLEEKLRIDGIEPDAFILKPNLRNILRGRFRAIRGQVGYKLEALFRLRRRTAHASSEILFGDDAEQDALIYTLYDDINQGHIGLAFANELLYQARVYPDVIDTILDNIARNGSGPSVTRIFINLDRHSPTSLFIPYGARLVPIHNYFQAALVLYQDHVLDAASLLRVALDMNQLSKFSPDMLANSFQDLARRRRITPQTLDRWRDELPSVQPPADLPRSMHPEPFIQELLQRLHALPKAVSIQTLANNPLPDYRALIQHHAKKKRRPNPSLA